MARLNLSANPIDAELFAALESQGPMTYHELYRAIWKRFGPVEADIVDRTLVEMRERGDVVRAGLRPPGEHLFALAR